VVRPDVPNIVVILTDDQGWNGTSARMDGQRSDSRSDFYETPNIERLSAMGMTFSNGYGSPNCSPSRLSLQTGKSAPRLKMTEIVDRNWGVDYTGHLLRPPGHVDNPAGRIYAIPEAEQTIVEMIKARNSAYATAHFRNGIWLAPSGPHGLTNDGDGQRRAGGRDDPKLVSPWQRGQGFKKRRRASRSICKISTTRRTRHPSRWPPRCEVQAKTPGNARDPPPP
jgi:hypothetical protein